MTPTLTNPAVWALAQGKVLLWFMVLVRLSGLLAMLPGLGQERVPVIIRAALAILVATILTPVVPAPKALPSGMWDLLGFMVVEFGSGLLMGLMVAWILEAVMFAGHIMDIQVGFSFVQFLDPVSAQSVSISGSVLSQLTLLFILISGLHHQMILALVESYRILPIGQAPPMRAQELTALLGMLLTKGLQLASPVLIVLFFVDVLEGISAKFMPQLQLIQLSFPIKIAVGLAVLAFALREFAAWLQPLVEWAPRQALRMLS